jgi:hypothetical protein
MTYSGRVGLFFAMFFALRMTQVLSCPGGALCQIPQPQDLTGLSGVFSLLYVILTAVQLPFVLLVDALAMSVFGGAVPEPFSWIVHPAISAIVLALAFTAIEQRFKK